MNTISREQIEKQLKEKRRNVIEAINTERDYQDSLPGNLTDRYLHSVGESILLLEEYVQRAKQEWVNNAGDWDALDEIRKIAAIAVRCMEQHGAPRRENKTI